MSLDLNKSNVSAWAESGYEFELVIPGTVEDTGAFITVRGVESNSAKAFARKKIKEQQRAEQMQKGKNKPTQVNIEEMEEELAEIAVSRVISWRGITDGGAEVPFTHENAMRIFQEHTWIRDAVLDTSNKIENFRP